MQISLPAFLLSLTLLTLSTTILALPQLFASSLTLTPSNLQPRTQPGSKGKHRGNLLAAPPAKRPPKKREDIEQIEIDDPAFHTLALRDLLESRDDFTIFKVKTPANALVPPSDGNPTRTRKERRSEADEESPTEDPAPASITPASDEPLLPRDRFLEFNVKTPASALVPPPDGNPV